MSQRSFRLVTTLGLAATLWVMPSVGTQGMGTIGARVTHPDRSLVDAPRQTDHGARQHVLLERADATVEAALGF